MDVPNVVDPTSTEAAAAANTSDPDSALRVLVQTQTHLVPGDKSTEFGERYDAMVNLIFQHLWQREYDKFRERVWNYHCHFALDNVECWFLVDHHGPNPSSPPDPPIICVMIRDPLPGRVRRDLRHYPFQRVAYHVLIQEYRKRRTPRVYKSRAEEICVKREMLRDTLLSNLGLTEELVRFAQDCHGAAEWVKARVPPDTWARLEDHSDIVLPLEPKEGHTWTESSDRVERPES
ncbi:hypothetical protein VTI74DRAFT_9919 [Chaetomium olivicolor]